MPQTPTEEALLVLQAMVQAGKANVLAFNMALKACERAGDAARALRLLGEMEGAGYVKEREGESLSVCVVVVYVRC